VLRIEQKDGEAAEVEDDSARNIPTARRIRDDRVCMAGMGGLRVSIAWILVMIVMFMHNQ
jgi:hypothetical protein